MNNKGLQRFLAIALMLAMTLTLAVGCRSGQAADQEVSADNSIEKSDKDSLNADDAENTEEAVNAAGDTASGDKDKEADKDGKDKKTDNGEKNDKKTDSKDQTSSTAKPEGSASANTKPAASADQPSASTPLPAEESKPSGSAGQTGASPAAQAVSLFNTCLSAGSVSSIADSILSKGSFPFEAGVTSVQEGYLNGFSENISGFSSGACISPYIGSIPFIAYVFESDDPQALASELKAKADLRWNVCTEADEMKCSVSGSHVFFVMAPASFE